MNNLAAGLPRPLGQARPGICRCHRGDAGAEEGQARPRPPRHAREHEQPRPRLPGRRQARPGAAAVRGDAGAAEGEARPRPPRHAHQHEQPRSPATRPPVKLDRALPLLRELADLWKRKAGADSTQYAGALAALGLNLLQQEKWTEAEPVLREAPHHPRGQSPRRLDNVQHEVDARRGPARSEEIRRRRALAPGRV